MFPAGARDPADDAHAATHAPDGDARLLGRPKELLGWVPREVVQAVQMEKAKLAHKGTLWFSDGSAYEIDVARAGGEPDRLGRALGLHA